MITRYRIRGRPFLCLTPEEAVVTGVTAGEETVEMIIFEEESGFGHKEFGVLRKGDENELKQISITERKERYFDKKTDAVQYLRSRGSEQYALFGIKEKKIAPRVVEHEAGEAEHQALNGFLDELKMFDTKKRQG